MKIASWNVNSLRVRLPQVLEWLAAQEPDVLGLQETKLQDKDFPTAAFEAAGFRDAFRVEVMPEGADPMDIRYNVINWVHRSTRGWSTGGSVSDPRTGEIMKGLVTLGSLRVRQDYMIAEGLLAPYVNGDENPQAIADWALARVSQLSAHEVGHTIGFAPALLLRISVGGATRPPSSSNWTLNRLPGSLAYSSRCSSCPSARAANSSARACTSSRMRAGPRSST